MLHLPLLRLPCAPSIAESVIRLIANSDPVDFDLPRHTQLSLVLPRRSKNNKSVMKLGQFSLYVEGYLPEKLRTSGPIGFVSPPQRAVSGLKVSDFFINPARYPLCLFASLFSLNSALVFSISFLYISASRSAFHALSLYPLRSSSAFRKSICAGLDQTHTKCGTLNLAILPSRTATFLL